MMQNTTVKDVLARRPRAGQTPNLPAATVSKKPQGTSGIRDDNAGDEKEQEKKTPEQKAIDEIKKARKLVEIQDYGLPIVDVDLDKIDEKIDFIRYHVAIDEDMKKVGQDTVRYLVDKEVSNVPKNASIKTTDMNKENERLTVGEVVNHTAGLLHVVAQLFPTSTMFFDDDNSKQGETPIFDHLKKIAGVTFGLRENIGLIGDKSRLRVATVKERKKKKESLNAKSMLPWITNTLIPHIDKHYCVAIYCNTKNLQEMYDNILYYFNGDDETIESILETYENQRCILIKKYVSGLSKMNIDYAKKYVKKCKAGDVGTSITSVLALFFMILTIASTFYFAGPQILTFCTYMIGYIAKVGISNISDYIISPMISFFLNLSAIPMIAPLILAFNASKEVFVNLLNNAVLQMSIMGGALVASLFTLFFKLVPLFTEMAGWGMNPKYWYRVWYVIITCGLKTSYNTADVTQNLFMNSMDMDLKNLTTPSFLEKNFSFGRRLYSFNIRMPSDNVNNNLMNMLEQNKPYKFNPKRSVKTSRRSIKISRKKSKRIVKKKSIRNKRSVRKNK